MARLINDLLPTDRANAPNKTAQKSPLDSQVVREHRSRLFTFCNMTCLFYGLKRLGADWRSIPGSSDYHREGHGSSATVAVAKNHITPPINLPPRWAEKGIYFPTFTKLPYNGVVCHSELERSEGEES